MKSAVAVARRCVCLELLHQRLGLETDREAGVDERETVRAAWAARLERLALEGELLPEERTFLERPVGSLSEDDLDDLEGRATGAIVFLWALGRTEMRPTYEASLSLDETLATGGLLGDGSIARANEAIANATLRDAIAISEALATFERLRGKAKEPTEPDRIMAGVAAHHLAWVLDDAARFD